MCRDGICTTQVREHWKKEFNALPDSMSTGVASRSKVLVTKKLELLVLLNQLEIVERNVWRVARPLRLKFQSIILNWRKHLGYSALSSATAGFDKETLLKLQELFAELDADGSGYLDAEELGVLFKNMRMPMGQRELDDIVDEIDVDGNGVYAVSPPSTSSPLGTAQHAIDATDRARPVSPQVKSTSRSFCW